MKLRFSGKTIENLAAEYGVAKLTICTWEKKYKKSKEFGINANLSDEEKELRNYEKIAVIKVNQQNYSISKMYKFWKVPRSSLLLCWFNCFSIKL